MPALLIALLFLIFSSFLQFHSIAQESINDLQTNTSQLSKRVQLDQHLLRQHVFRMASDEFQGRRGEGSSKTVEYIEEHFRKHKLNPAFPTGFIQEIVQASSGKTIGKNVAAMVEGRDPILKKEWIIVSAHWDHLGHDKPTGKNFAGADDNATGVAMLLECAAWFAKPENKPLRSILFVSFDLEEFGLFGSRYFTAHMPVDESSVKLFVTADMIGRSLSGICREWVFVIGSERLPQSRDWLNRATVGRSIKAGLLGTDLVGVRSDYGPFMARRMPYLFFSTGESDVYHTVDDLPETVDYQKLDEISELISETVQLAANSSQISKWQEPAQPAPEEMTVIASVLNEMKSPQNGLKLAGYQRTTIDRTLDKIKQLTTQSTITASDRKAIIRAAQFLMFTAL